MMKNRKVFYKKIDMSFPKKKGNGIYICEPKCPYFDDVWFANPSVGSNWCKNKCSRFIKENITKILRRNFIKCKK
jgi:hypothetical protein